MLSFFAPGGSYQIHKKKSLRQTQFVFAFGNLRPPVNGLDFPFLTPGCQWSLASLRTSAWAFPTRLFGNLEGGVHTKKIFIYIIIYTCKSSFIMFFPELVLDVIKLGNCLFVCLFCFLFGLVCWLVGSFVFLLNF